MATLVNVEQSSKALSAMVATPSKSLCPMAVSVFPGIVTVFNELHPLKAFFPMSLSVFGNSIVSNAVHPLKAPCPITLSVFES